MSRFIIIGDIHGCADELNNLINSLSITDSDQIISIGDILHKGPDEKRAIEIIKKYSKCYLIGNHEEKQFRWERHEDIREETGKKNPMKHVEDYERLPSNLLKWLYDKGSLYLHISAGEKLFTLVHGGIEPALKELSWGLPKHIKSLKKKKPHMVNVLRTRYVNPKGYMVSLGNEKKEDIYWAEIYDGRFGHVIFGHQPFLDRKTPREFPHATGIDLGCVYGNVLCAYIIDGETGETSYVTVPARGKYQTRKSELKKDDPRRKILKRIPK